LTSARERRKANKKEKISDVFGDFFGFGANPPGCLKKDLPNFDFKKEKVKFLAMLNEEIKQYDLQTIKSDMDSKIEIIVNGIKKEEKLIMNEENKQLRNLDKLHYMYDYLQEDNKATSLSQQQAQNTRDQSKQEMQEYEESND